MDNDELTIEDLDEVRAGYITRAEYLMLEIKKLESELKIPTKTSEEKEEIYSKIEELKAAYQEYMAENAQKTR